MVISTKWRKKVLILNIDLTGHKKCMLSTALGIPERHKSSFYFGIGGPRFFLRVVVTIISKRLVKLGIILYYRI